MKRAVLASLLITLAFTTAHAETSYRRYNGDVYGSDGTRIHEFGGDTYIRKPDGREVKCHEFAGTTTCR